MGGDTTTTTTVQPSAQEQELLGLQLELAQASQPLQLQTIGFTSDLINALLTGSELPGGFGDLLEGVSDETAQELATQGVQTALPQFQASGILDSGVAAKLSSELATDILTDVEQSNLANQANLLSLALTGQAAFQQPILQSTSNLSSQLAGLRTVSGTQAVPNPFLTSFQTSLGQSLGSGQFGGFTAFG